MSESRHSSGVGHPRPESVREKTPFDPVPVIGFGDGTSPPRPTPGMGKNSMLWPLARIK